jgi:hypothetical protein
VDPALDRIDRLIRKGPDPVALAASRDVLDRAGLKAPVKLDVSVTIHALRQRLDRMPTEDTLRLVELLGSVDLTDEEQAELSRLREAAGLVEGDGE